ncbi:MAG: hypothetical protein SGPRY_013143, partial [Prymnesium sp.]
FGCVSAVHRCPHCTHPFDYHPQDYHRQVVCGNPRCEKPFGFFLYHVPPRVENELRVEIKAVQASHPEKRLKQREASAARSQRAARKEAPMSDEARQKHAEKLFVRNLLDECPRCGFTPPQSADFESLSMHLKGCNDKRAHEAHRRTQAAAAAAREAKERREDADVEAQNLAAWQFLGGSTESMWLLTDTQLKKQCEGAGVESNGGREEMLARLSRHQAALQSQRLTSKGAQRPMLSLKTAPG